MSIAQSAASFVGTKPTTERKPRITKSKSEAKAQLEAEVGKDLVAAAEVLTNSPTTFAALVAQIVDAPKAAPKTSAKLATMLVIGKTFKPRTDQLVDRKADGKGNFAQQHNWDALVAAVGAAGGSISFADAVAAVEAAGKAGGYEKTCNARGFVQGRVRGGHLVTAK
jgi:hypothetical protein